MQNEIASSIQAQELSLKMLRVYCQRVLNFNVGARGLVANGRVLGPFVDDENFVIEDFSLLERFSSSSYLEKINVALEHTADDEEGKFSNLVKYVNY